MSLSFSLSLSSLSSSLFAHQASYCIASTSTSDLSAFRSLFSADPGEECVNALGADQAEGDMISFPLNLDPVPFSRSTSACTSHFLCCVVADGALSRSPLRLPGNHNGSFASIAGVSGKGINGDAIVRWEQEDEEEEVKKKSRSGCGADRES